MEKFNVCLFKVEEKCVDVKDKNHYKKKFLILFIIFLKKMICWKNIIMMMNQKHMN